VLDCDRVGRRLFLPYRFLEALGEGTEDGGEGAEEGDESGGGDSPDSHGTT